MKFRFMVYYIEKDESIRLYKKCEKYKIVTAKTEGDALKKFKEKYPDFIPVYAV